MKKKTTNSINIKVMCGIAVFSALAYCTALVTNIPVSFLTFDAKDAVITIASFIYGPVSAVFMSLITAFLEFVTFGKTGVYGLIMDIISTTVFTVTASLMYKYSRNLKGAVISLVTAAALYVAVMMGTNLLITPYYMGVTVEAVKELIPTLLLPFNAAKALMNSALVMAVYKPVATLTRRLGFAEEISSSRKPERRDSIIMLSIATAAFVIAVIIFVILKK